MNNNICPFISIVMSIYNAKNTLHYSIDSLVNQSLENIEIILVDKGSTDGSDKIIDMYAERFPNKVRAFHLPYSNSPSVGWNYGVSAAKADYIAFCDADDSFIPEAMSTLYDIVRFNPCDMVFFYARLVSGDRTIRIDKYTSDFTKESLICCDSGMNAVWNKLWHKSLFEKTGPMIDTLSHDIVYCPSAISNANTFAECPMAIYNHTAEGGISKGYNSIRSKAIFSGWDSLFQLNFNQEYKDAVMTSLAKRICIAERNFPRFKDDIAIWVQSHKELFINNPVLKKRKDCYDQIMSLVKLGNDFIPKIIYVNGFGGGLSEEWIEHIRKKAFNFSDAEIVILNESNCSCNCSDTLIRALENHDHKYLGHYFALKKIFETGGFYLSGNIEINISLNTLRLYSPAVFSFLDTKNYIDDFFCAKPGAKVIRSLIKTYETDFYPDIYCPLSERIKNILTAEYDVMLNGCFQQYADVTVISPDVSVTDCMNQNNLFTTNLTEYLDKPGFSVMNEDILVIEIIQKKQDCEEKLEEIYSSDAYKLARRLSIFGNTKIGSIPKRIFKKALKVYRKYKYGIE